MQRNGRKSVKPKNRGETVNAKKMETTQTARQTATLKQHSRSFNPLFLQTDKGGIEINHFVFFDNKTGKAILDNGGNVISEHCELCRWFNNSGSNNDYPEIQFPFPIIKKREIDLTRNFAFYGTYQSKYNFDKGKIVVFIPVCLLENFKVKKNVFLFKTDTEKVYQDFFYFDVLAIKKLHRLNEAGQLEYYNGELEKQTLNFHGYNKSVNTPFGEKVETVEKTLKDKGVKIGGYELEQLMKVYELSPI